MNNRLALMCSVALIALLVGPRQHDRAGPDRVLRGPTRACVEGAAKPGRLRSLFCPALRHVDAPR